MLKVQFDGDVLVCARGPNHGGGRGHADENGRRISRRSPKDRRRAGRDTDISGLRERGAFADYARFITNHVVGVEMRYFPFAEGAAAEAWLRSP